MLAEIDPYLCEQVAAGLGLPAPKPVNSLPSVEPSPALSQLGQTWPTTGRIIGIVADDGSDLETVRALRRTILDGGMVPLVIAPAGGVLGADGGDPVTVQRTFVTARSVEFDALLLAGTPAPGKDAHGARDAKAGNGVTGMPTDPRVLLMLAEAFRHAKPLAGWADAERALTAAGIDTSAPGVLVADSGDAALEEVVRLLARHRVWDRFPATAGIV